MNPSKLDRKLTIIRQRYIKSYTHFELVQVEEYPKGEKPGDWLCFIVDFNIQFLGGTSLGLAYDELVDVGTHVETYFNVHIMINNLTKK